MENESTAAVLDRVKKKVEKYASEPDSKYTLRLDEVNDLLQIACNDPFTAFYFAYRISYEKGRRAAIAEMKKQKQKT